MLHSNTKRTSIGILAIAAALVIGDRVSAADRVVQAPQTPQLAPKQAPGSIYDRMVNELAPLKNGDKRGDRFPLVLWTNPVPVNFPGSFSSPITPISQTQVQNLLARGFTQTVPQHSAGYNEWTLNRIIQQAQALQAAGSPVIMLEGKGGQFPLDTLQVPAGFTSTAPSDQWDLSGSPDFEKLQNKQTGQMEWTAKVYPNTRWQHQFDQSKVVRIDPSTGQIDNSGTKTDVYGRPVYWYVTARDGNGVPVAAEPIRAALSSRVGFENQRDNPAPNVDTFGGTLATMNKIKAAGVNVDAVWHDWEGAPLWNELNYNQARDSKIDNPWGNGGTDDQKAASAFSPDNFDPGQGNYLFSKFTTSAWRLYQSRMAEFISGPTKQVFPEASTTNWFATYSSTTPGARQIYNYNSLDAQPTTSAPLGFTAMNPVAYASDQAYRSVAATGRDLSTQEHVDQAYTWWMLQQATNNEYNLKLDGISRQSVVWVARWDPNLPADGVATIPIMSRERYKEALRHLWLRGADAMQVFNVERKNYEELAWQEVVDAYEVYDEMLAFADLLNTGEVMNFDLPAITMNGLASAPLISGLRDIGGDVGDQAVVRLFMQGFDNGQVTLEAWSGKFITLDATVTGNTYLLQVMADGSVQVVTAVPEPGTVAMLGLVGAAFALRRRRVQVEAVN